MIKIGVFYRIMLQTWHIVMAQGLDGFAEDTISTITHSTSEYSIHKYETSRLRKPTQIINVSSCHQLIPRTWRILMTEGLGPGREIACILRRPQLTDSYSCDFENPNENMSLASQTKIWKMISDPIQSQIIYFYILLFSYVPGLYFVSSSMW